MHKIGEVKINGEKMRIEQAWYKNCDMPGFVIVTKDGEPYATITVNLPDDAWALKDDEVFVKTWSENEHLVKPLLETGLFEDTRRRVPTGYVEAQIWKMKFRPLL